MTVATVPNLKAIKLPRPQEAVPGWPRPPLLHHLRLQCTCISGWPGLNKRPTAGGKGQTEAGHAYHARMMGASPGLPRKQPCFVHTAHAPIPTSYQNSSFNSLFLGAWSLTLKGDLLLHLLL